MKKLLIFFVFLIANSCVQASLVASQSNSNLEKIGRSNQSLSEDQKVLTLQSATPSIKPAYFDISMINEIEFNPRDKISDIFNKILEKNPDIYISSYDKKINEGLFH